MIVTEILGNIHEESGRELVVGRHVEKVVLPSTELVKRIQRLSTDHDREIGLRLPAGAPDLKDGDVVAVEDATEVAEGGAGEGHGYAAVDGRGHDAADGTDVADTAGHHSHAGSGRGNAIVVQVLPTDVLVIGARSITEMAFVAHSLGNRHLQAQFFDEDSEYGAQVMVVQYDHTVQDFLEHHGVPYSRQERVMPVPFRHAEHTH